MGGRGPTEGGKTTAAVVLGLFLLGLLVSGCAGRRAAKVTFHEPGMDFSLVHTVAVLPFGNLTPVQTAGERVREVFMTMLQATGAVYVLPPGEVSRAIARAGLSDPTSPAPDEVVSLGKLLGADAIITGTVLEYGETRSGTAAASMISLTARMMEAKTGRVVWSASSTKGGIGPGARLFGGGGEPMNEVTTKAVDDLLDKLFR